MEEKVAVIPRLEVWSGSGSREYGLLLTDEQSIFVLLAEKWTLVGALVGAGVGMAIAQGFLLLAASDLSNFGNASQLIGAIPGAIAGALTAEAAARTRSFDWGRTEASALASDRKNITVPHAALQHLRLERRGGTYRLRTEYTNPKGKRRKLEFVVTPPRDYVKRRKGQGVKRKDAAREYANQLVSAFQGALPPAAAVRAEWRL